MTEKMYLLRANGEFQGLYARRSDAEKEIRAKVTRLISEKSVISVQFDSDGRICTVEYAIAGNISKLTLEVVPVTFETPGEQALFVLLSRMAERIEELEKKLQQQTVNSHAEVC